MSSEEDILGNSVLFFGRANDDDRNDFESACTIGAAAGSVRLPTNPPTFGRNDLEKVQRDLESVRRVANDWDINSPRRSTTPDPGDPDAGGSPRPNGASPNSAPNNWQFPLQYGNIILPKWAPTPTTLVEWHRQLTAAIIGITPYSDEREIVWIDEVFRCKLNELSDKGQPRWYNLQAKLTKALEDYPLLPPSIRKCINLEQMRHYRSQKVLQGRQVLWILYKHMNASIESCKVALSKKMDALTWYGDHDMERFMGEWDSIKDENTLYKALDKNVMTARFRHILKQSPSLKPGLSQCLIQRGVNLEAYENLVRNTILGQKQEALEESAAYSGAYLPAGDSSGKRKICFQFLQGTCKFGSSCRFSHDAKPNTGSAGQKGKSYGQSGKSGNKGQGKGTRPNAQKGGVPPHNQGLNQFVEEQPWKKKGNFRGKKKGANSNGYNNSNNIASNNVGNSSTVTALSPPSFNAGGKGSGKGKEKGNSNNSRHYDVSSFRQEEAQPVVGNV